MYPHILPALKPGVIIHIHGAYHPFEYPRRWVLHHKRSRNERFLADIMPSHGGRCDGMFFNDAMQQKRADKMRRPGDMFGRSGKIETNPRQQVNGSIWLRKR